jgi:hypothetical protein
MIERRSHLRLGVSRPVLYSTSAYPTPQVASTIDLSLGGTRIERGYFLTRGTKLQISIALQSQVIKCRGKVLYTQLLSNQRLIVGIQFEELSGRDRVHLRQYLSELIEQRAWMETH